MKCPLDQSDLLITERQGVEIDYCPTCRGVWLDRGELDKLIDRAEKYDKRDRSRDDDDDDRNRLPYQPPRGAQPTYPASNPGRAPGPDIAGMVGDVLKKKLEERNRGGYDRDDYRHHGHKKKKGGLLGELFDF
jgi:hypothetical protein